MADIVVPTNNVSYWIQNVDFGTFLGIIDEYPINRTTRGATFAARSKKEGDPTQEWTIQDAGNGKWAVVNHALSVFIDGNNGSPTVTTFNPRKSISPASAVSVEQENETDIVKIKTNFGTLQTTTGFDLKIAADGDFDRMKWRLIPKCALLVQVGFKYRLRALNGRILNLDGAGKYSAMVLADAIKEKSNSTLWTIEPAPGGRCFIKISGGGENDYLASQTVYTSGQNVWVINKGPAHPWDIESIGNFGYQFVKQPDSRSFALTVENDTDVILKSNKVGHGQIWLVERDYN